MARTYELEEAVALLRPTDSVGFGLGPANPACFLTALGQRRDWEDLTLGGALFLGLFDVLAHPDFRVALHRDAATLG
jgi:acyl-CoA hydrolase